MKNLTRVALVLVAIAFFVGAVKADDTLLRVKGAIGVIPVRGSAAAPVTNVVRGVDPPGNIWVIEDLVATVKTTVILTSLGEVWCGVEEITSGRQLIPAYLSR